MKKIMCLVFLLFAFCVGIVSAEWVAGYYRANGTYVRSYYRTDKNSTVYDNLSYKPKKIYKLPSISKKWWDY